MSEIREIPIYEVQEDLNALILFCRANSEYAEYEKHLLRMEEQVLADVTRPGPDDDPWLEQAAEHEACAMEGIYSPPPPGYPHRPDP